MEPRMAFSGLTKRWYIVTLYTELEGRQIIARKKFDVTDQVERILTEIEEGKAIMSDGRPVNLVTKESETHQHECDPIGRPASHDTCVCKCGATNVNGEGWE